MPEFGLNHLLRVIGDEILTGEPIIRLPSLHNDGSTVEEITSNDDLVFLIPGVEGKFILIHGIVTMSGFGVY